MSTTMLWCDMHLPRTRIVRGWMGGEGDVCEAAIEAVVVRGGVARTMTKENRIAPRASMNMSLIL